MSDEKRSEDEVQNTTHDKPADAGEAGVEATGGGGGGFEEAPEEADDGDAANPAAIARRVAALGADDATEALAREEERKLAERRAGKKKGKKKSGLEAAASKRLANIGTRAEPKRTVAVAADADPLIERTAKLSEWAKKNQSKVQAFGIAAIVGLLVVAGIMYYDHKRELEASTILTKAVEAQSARVGEPPKSEDDDNHELFYKTYDERRGAALKQYKDVESKFSGTGAAILARLAEGSLLLDKRDADGALAAFNDVKGSPLAAADTEVKGRALEGIGFANEIKAAATPAEKAKSLDAALAAYKDMENAADVKGFKEMAMYHQARVLQAKGNKDQAKEILVALKERLNKTDETATNGLPPPPSFPYLKEVAMDRLHEIDPTSAPAKATHKSPPGGAGGQPTQEQIRKMMEQMQKKGGH